MEEFQDQYDIVEFLHWLDSNINNFETNINNPPYIFL